MKLSISNIAWTNENDEEMYKYISDKKFDAIEIAPTRIFDTNPYDMVKEANKFAKKMKKEYQLKISSIQSIWYGKSQKIFDNEEERKELMEYTKKSIDFAQALNCTNIVFGCPKNRNIKNKDDYKVAIEFFRMIGEYAKTKHTIFSIEPNPIIYNTNFINTTKEAFDIVKDINHDAVKVNLDLGTMIANNEMLDELESHYSQINHIHISEPNLEIIQRRKMHIQLAQKLRENNYQNYISVEMKKTDNIDDVKKVIDYIEGVFG